MTIVRDQITLAELKRLAEGQYGELVKAVVDVERGVMAVGAELHADEERELLLDGSEQGALWGIYLYPVRHGTSAWIEYDSMINLRPRLGNRTRSVDDPSVRERITTIVDRSVAP